MPYPLLHSQEDNAYREYRVSYDNRATARIAELLAIKCGVCPTVAKQIHTAAALHDLGKQKIPANILNKPGKLTPREFEIVKTHTTLGAEMLVSVQGKLGAMVRATALYHHEYYDGSGYWNKHTDELPFFLPIVTISDVFVALIAHRPYKQVWTKKEALGYIRDQVGKRFSPALVDVFLPLIRHDDRISAILSDLRK